MFGETLCVNFLCAVIVSSTVEDAKAIIGQIAEEILILFLVF